MTANLTPVAGASAHKAGVFSVDTAEGVTLRFSLAMTGDRLVAYIIDLFMMLLILLGVVLAMSFVDTAAKAKWGVAIAGVMSFVIVNFYFAWFEIRRNGSTPGKSRVGIRVISRTGGPLSVQAILVRNMTRNIEIMVPLQILMVPESIFPDSPQMASILAIVWLVLISALPLFNKQRLRAGDILGGTIVVDIKQSELEEDMTLETRLTTYRFTSEQLSKYGIYELQVLEDYLRSHWGARSLDPALLVEKIQRKIGWTGERVKASQSEQFLKDFYAAQRHNLEQRMLLGDRKERKD